LEGVDRVCHCVSVGRGGAGRLIPSNKAGPDGAFWLSLGDEWILVVVQSKFAAGFDVDHALRTIDPATFYWAASANITTGGRQKTALKAENTKQANLAKLRAEAVKLIKTKNVGVLSILVCLPGAAPTPLVPGLSMRGDGSIQLVIDSTNAADGLFSEEVVNTLLKLKTKC